MFVFEKLLLWPIERSETAVLMYEITILIWLILKCWYLKSFNSSCCVVFWVVAETIFVFSQFEIGKKEEGAKFRAFKLKHVFVISKSFYFRLPEYPFHIGQGYFWHLFCWDLILVSLVTIVRMLAGEYYSVYQYKMGVKSNPLFCTGLHEIIHAKMHKSPNCQNRIHILLTKYFLPST